MLYWLLFNLSILTISDICWYRKYATKPLRSQLFLLMALEPITTSNGITGLVVVDLSLPVWSSSHFCWDVLCSSSCQSLCSSLCSGACSVIRNQKDSYCRCCSKVWYSKIWNTGRRRSRVVTFTAIRLRGPGFKPRPRQKFENENFCFRRTPAVVKACHLCRVRPIKMPLPVYKTWIPMLSFILIRALHSVKCSAFQIPSYEITVPRWLIYYDLCIYIHLSFASL